jgi:cobalt-zinc-cadmium efflux system membrane fusion protein
MNGYIKEISVHDGKFVNKGEVIAVLEHPDFLQLQSDYLMEKSRYGFLNLDYERQLKLNKQNINSNKEFQRVKSEWEQSGIRLGSLKSRLEMLRVDIDRISASSISPLFSVKAPISGYCEGISIALGQFVRPDEIVVEVVNRVEFLIVLKVFEKDIASVLPGQSVNFLCPDPGSQVVSHLGKVIYSGQKIDETSRTFQVYASPNEDYENMRHGMMIRANIELSGVSVLTVPTEALVYSDQGEFLFIREGEIFRPVKVQTGLSDSGYIEIVNRNDIEGKDIVLKGGVYLMAEMQKE